MGVVYIQITNPNSTAYPLTNITSEILTGTKKILTCNQDNPNNQTNKVQDEKIKNDKVYV